MWKRPEIRYNYFGEGRDKDEPEGPTLTELRLQREAEERAKKIGAAFDKLLELKKRE